jgi:hypothetical protein
VNSLHAKLIVVVLAVLITGSMLLVCRHRRIEVAYRMARVHERHVEQERAMWKLRSTTAERCRPGIVREMMDSLGEAWATLPARENAPHAPAAPETVSPRALATPDSPARTVDALASRGAGGG